MLVHMLAWSCVLNGDALANMPLAHAGLHIYLIYPSLRIMPWPILYVMLLNLMRFRSIERQHGRDAVILWRKVDVKSQWNRLYKWPEPGRRHHCPSFSCPQLLQPHSCSAPPHPSSIFSSLLVRNNVQLQPQGTNYGSVRLCSQRNVR